jgi:tetratricopeptide (TPR) repeat protein
MTPARAASVVRPIREDHLGASTFIEKGWNYIALGEYVEAEKALETALRHAPSDLNAQALLGWSRMGQNRYDEAMEILDRVLAADPMNAMARATIGYVCMRKGMLIEAHDHLSKASTQMRDPKAALYGCFYMGLLYAQQRDVIEAERCFRRTLSLAPNFIEAYYELGRTFWNAGQREEAENVWKSGNAANRFNAWGKRCADAIRLSKEGRTPPSFS